MEFNTITRKIEIFVNENDTEKKNLSYKTLRDWSYYSRNYANDSMNILQASRVIDNHIKINRNKFERRTIKKGGLKCLFVKSIQPD